MSKEQIEEMAKLLESTCDKTECNHPRNCDLCQATYLYNAGYRKQSEGEWKKENNKRTCSICKYEYFANNTLFNYCPNCGTKMTRKENERK